MDPTRDYSRCVLTSPGAHRPLTSLEKSSADICEGIRDNSIIHSPSFTFLVGPKHTKLTIQSGLAQHVSRPLHNLMNNGHTRESKHRIAVLEDEDVETFVAFCEYAYTGNYSVPQQAVPREDDRLKAEVPLSPTSPRNSWRQSQRSESFSSAVPPAPSPPPEPVDSTGQTAKLLNEPEPEPTIAEDPSAEAAAEGENIEEAKQTELDKKEPDLPDEPVQESAASHSEPEAEAVGELVAEPVAEPVAADLELEVEEPEEEAGPNVAPRPLSAKEKKKARKAALKKQREHQNLYADEPQANPTPPSTPPPEPATECLPTEDPVFEDAPATNEEDHMTWPDQPADAAASEHESEPEPEQGTEPKSQPEPESEPLQTSSEGNLEPEPEPASGEHENAAPLSEKDSSREENWGDSEEGRRDQDQSSESQKPVIDMSFAKQSGSLPCTPGLSLWDEFTALQYNDERQIPTLPASEPPTTELPYLTFHAKVYVFATRYLIPALAQLCLRKLHRDLRYISFSDLDYIEQDSDSHSVSNLASRQVPMVLDLLRYAYFKTTRLEPISPTSATQLRENELRRLVVHFAACKIKELASYHPPGQSGAATPAVRPFDSKLQRAEFAIPPSSLRALLDMTPELASDLVYRMI